MKYQTWRYIIRSGLGKCLSGVEHQDKENPGLDDV